MAQSSEHRKQAYRMYRSMGYSPKAAASMRNRGHSRLITDYRRGMDKYTAQYDKPKAERTIDRPYRPEIEAKPTQVDHFEKMVHDNFIPAHIVDQMEFNNDAFDLDVYTARIEGFREFFESQGIDWQDFIDDFDIIDDLGDFLDALGEKYSEAKGGE